MSLPIIIIYSLGAFYFPSMTSITEIINKRGWNNFKLLHFLLVQYLEGFPDGSDGKEFACNAEDLGLISGSGRFPRQGNGYPLQCSWGSLVVQLVKNLPAMPETWVQSLGWEDPLESMATHSSILAWRIPMDREDWRATVNGVAKSWTWLSN